MNERRLKIKKRRKKRKGERTGGRGDTCRERVEKRFHKAPDFLQHIMTLNYELIYLLQFYINILEPSSGRMTLQTGNNNVEMALSQHSPTINC